MAQKLISQENLTIDFESIIGQFLLQMCQKKRYKRHNAIL